MYKRILVTTDGSTLSNKAVKNAVQLAQTTGAELVALHVVPRYPASYWEGGVTVTEDQVARIERQWSDNGHALVEAVQKVAEAAGVKTKSAIARSDLVAEAIIAA